MNLKLMLYAGFQPMNPICESLIQEGVGTKPIDVCVLYQVRLSIRLLGMSQEGEDLPEFKKDTFFQLR